MDLWAFETGATEGREARAAGDLAAAFAAFERAVEVYAGELLPEAARRLGRPAPRALRGSGP